MKHNVTQRALRTPSMRFLLTFFFLVSLIVRAPKGPPFLFNLKLLLLEKLF